MIKPPPKEKNFTVPSEPTICRRRDATWPWRDEMNCPSCSLDAAMRSKEVRIKVDGSPMPLKKEREYLQEMIEAYKSINPA